MKKLNAELVKNMWDYLVNIAKNWDKKTYLDVSKDLKIWSPEQVWKILGPIQDYCIKNSKPKLTSLIINKKTKYPWDWFLQKGLSYEQIWKEVYEYKWEKVPFNKEKSNNIWYINKWNFNDINEDFNSWNILLEWFPEWEKLEVRHKKYERNQKIIKEAKENHKLKNNWELPCEICKFNFRSEYWNKDYIEAHHKIPLSFEFLKRCFEIFFLNSLSTNIFLRSLVPQIKWIHIFVNERTDIYSSIP